MKAKSISCSTPRLVSQDNERCAAVASIPGVADEADVAGVIGVVVGEGKEGGTGGVADGDTLDAPVRG